MKIKTGAFSQRSREIGGEDFSSRQKFIKVGH